MPNPRFLSLFHACITRALWISLLLFFKWSNLIIQKRFKNNITLIKYSQHLSNITSRVEVLRVSILDAIAVLPRPRGTRVLNSGLSLQFAPCAANVNYQFACLKLYRNDILNISSCNLLFSPNIMFLRFIHFALPLSLLPSLSQIKKKMGFHVVFRKHFITLKSKDYSTWGFFPKGLKCYFAHLNL